jgi:hypothetical protein
MLNTININANITFFLFLSKIQRPGGFKVKKIDNLSKKIHDDVALIKNHFYVI